MKLIIQIFFILLITPLAAYGETRDKSAGYNVDSILESYINTWAMTDPQARRIALEEIWIKKGIHESPFSYSHGIEAINKEIDGFLKMFPNAVVRFNDVKRTNNKLVCAFVLQNANGEPLMTGVDYFELTDEGKIIKVIGFVDERQVAH